MKAFLPPYVTEKAPGLSFALDAFSLDRQPMPASRGTSVVVWDASDGKLRGTLADRDDDDAMRVRFMAKEVLSYLELLLNRNGIGGAGGSVNISIRLPVPNAFWWKDQLILGVGDGKLFSRDGFTKSIDVLAHEMSHGIIENVSPLKYWGEPGAINEHLADVIGTAIQQRVTPGRLDWCIGDEVMAEPGEALRSLRAPGVAYRSEFIGDDPQMLHYADRYQGSADNGGVHVNSGILNRMFFLVASNGMGTHEACRLWYATLLSLPPKPTFFFFAKALADQAASFKSGSVQLVRWAATEVGL